MSTSDKTARLAAAMSQLEILRGTQEQRSEPAVQRVHQAAANAASTDDVTRSMLTNPVYMIMSDAHKSDDQKINEVSKYLKADNEDFASARERFAMFEEYFNYAQTETIQVNVKGIERLVEDLKSGLKPEIEKIVKNLIAVQNGIQESEKLLEVMRAARLEGKTIEEIGAAIDMNDRILRQISDINDDIASLGETEAERQARLASQLERKAASETGFFNVIARNIMGPDKRIQAAIQVAEEQLSAARDEITLTQSQLAAKQAERNDSLESGPLVILRTMDVTEKSFSEHLVRTAEDSLGLINGASNSIDTLMRRTNNGEKASRDILGKLAEGERRQAILKGALQQVADHTFEQSQIIKSRLDAQDTRIEGTDNDVGKAVMKAERVDIAQRHSGALDYSEALNRTVSNLDAVSASDVEAKSQADQLHTLIQSEKELLKRLGLEALPATARALQIVLQTNGVQQTAELSVAISTLTQQARKTGQESLDKLLLAEGELEDHRLANMDAAIKALRHAEEAVIQRIESTIENGIQERGRMHGLSDAAGDLEGIVARLEEIRPTVTAREREESQASTVEAPERPGTLGLKGIAAALTPGSGTAAA